MSEFKLDIFTPNGIVIKGLVCDSFKIPTTSGEINVLPGHTHLLTSVSLGILEAKTSMGMRHFTMTSGLCKVLGDTVTILSTTSEKTEGIDIERAKNAKAKAESWLKERDPNLSAEYIKFHRKLERAKLRLEAANLK